MSMWYPDAIVRYGPSNKFGYPTSNPVDKFGHKKGTIYHSSEGTLSAWWSILDSQVIPRKSATFFNPKIGRLYQHYPANAHTWANGTEDANKDFVSCENEGLAGQPLTASQINNLVGLTIWLKAQFGWGELSRRTNMREHNEFRPTACPSGRIPWMVIITRAETDQEEEQMVSYLLHDLEKPRGTYYLTHGWMNKRRLVGFPALQFYRYIQVAEVGLTKDQLDEIPDQCECRDEGSGGGVSAAELAAHAADHDAHEGDH